MTRCDYDVVFYRVFCITLLGIAFTFTVILTNVFVDIDGLLTSKTDNINDDIIPNEFTTEATDNDYINYGEGDDSYRTKRSIETQSFLFHIKNPKVKNILANRLSTLLEELEAEETADMKPIEKKIVEEVPKVVEKPQMAEEEKKENMLHLSMHNILLQGIEKHMDLNDVFRRMYSLMSNFKQFHDKKDGIRTKPNEIGKEGEKPKPIEDKFFEEMLNFNKLQDQMQTTTVKPAKAPPNVVIKTVIDITSTDSGNLKENDTKISNENIQGAVELVYNGKVIKFSNSDAETAQLLQQKKVPVAYKPERTTMDTTSTYDYNMIPKSYMNKFVEEYFKHFPHNRKENNEINRHFQTKRLKRHVRIKYDNSREAKATSKKNTEEDELYVEIETHFDSKGMKGEKKKRLIKNLVEKIQNAIHSDMTIGKLVNKDRNNTKHRKSIHFRKRIQNPLVHNISQILINKYSLPITNTVHREQDPISKTVQLKKQSSSPLIATKSGENWWQPNPGPGFLAVKAINSAELSRVNVDYSKILEVNGIPQRLQQPLNTELSEETLKTNSYYDMGKMKFVIKDIDGSGFSVGFNQYVGEPPDAESMQLFAGLENVIKSYHQAYDENPEPVSTTEANFDDREIPIEMPNKEANFADEERPIESPNNEPHNIERRSINRKNDYHSNEYKVIFNKDFLNYRDYRDIYKGKKSKSHRKYTSKKDKKNPLVLDENIFEKNLKPAEILSLANLFERKKRSINVKKLSNLNTRLKYNKFLNTNAMSKTLYINTKRNKRQVNKIRIIASDLPHDKQSDENIYVVSDENVFADRAVLKEVETSDDHEKQEESEMFPFEYNDNGPYTTKMFDGRSRRNPLMSKYPHIFMEEVSRSREQYIPNNALLFGKLGFGKVNPETYVENTNDKLDIDQFMATTFNDTESEKPLQEQEFISSLIGSTPNKSNYKVTVKITPKNQTGINSGFKEIHTSINKSFNQNGLLYSSLVNVSEISKIIKLNKTREEAFDDKLYPKQEDSYLTRKIHDQQEKMQFLLKQHAKHINEQLNRLNEEKMNLESMLIGDNHTDINSNAAALHMTLRRMELLKSTEHPSTTMAPKMYTTKVVTKPREKLPQVTTTPAPVTPPTQLLSFSEKLKNNQIISTIERNGNLTDQILRKIDRNTEILQMFLRKLMERIETPSTAVPKVERETKDEYTYTPDWRNQGIPFTHNMIIRKNDSHISIPFTYAYQPPTSLPIKNKTQVAGVIYQGHIRNAVLQRDMDNGREDQIQKSPEAHNQSRFFIDELENEYKIIQMGGMKKNQDYLNLVIRNGTVT